MRQVAGDVSCSNGWMSAPRAFSSPGRRTASDVGMSGHTHRHSCACAHASAPVTAHRRHLLSAASVLLASPPFWQAQALESIPAGYDRKVDKLDGYTFVYPDSWISVTSSGNEVFKRNPRVADENAFVTISSPTSSRYAQVADLGTPDDASELLQKQFLKEYMSTRLGVRREVQPIFARSRTGARALSVPPNPQASTRHACASIYQPKL